MTAPWRKDRSGPREESRSGDRTTLIGRSRVRAAARAARMESDHQPPIRKGPAKCSAGPESAGVRPHLHEQPCQLLIVQRCRKHIKRSAHLPEHDAALLDARQYRAELLHLAGPV